MDKAPSRKVECPVCHSVVYSTAQNKFTHCGKRHEVAPNLIVEEEAAPTPAPQPEQIVKLPTPEDKPEDEDISQKEVEQAQQMEREAEIKPVEQQLDKSKLTGKTEVQQEAEQKHGYCPECGASNDINNTECRDCGFKLIE